METINWNDFNKIYLVTGTIINVKYFPEAKKPAYKIEADFGEYGIKKTSTQITDLYTKEELIGKQIIAIINFLPKQIGPFLSEFLLTGFYREDGKVVIAIPDKKIKNGSKLG